MRRIDIRRRLKPTKAQVDAAMQRALASDEERMRRKLYRRRPRKCPYTTTEDDLGGMLCDCTDYRRRQCATALSEGTVAPAHCETNWARYQNYGNVQEAVPSAEVTEAPEFRCPHPEGPFVSCDSSQACWYDCNLLHTDAENARRQLRAEAEERQAIVSFRPRRRR